MCRLIGVADDPRLAKKVGTVVAVSDFAGVVSVVASSTAAGQKRAALRNAMLDVLLATALLVIALRRRGAERIAAVSASGSVWFGAGAWAVAVRQLPD
jgi:hypothetical protein